eukprot:CAMPEP_0115866566 /NCGR_PEP_ID=MMETSP0287-20121206/20316_1 /TAXON_ID=412157 /ORGANISM="Chrysochromulina rotalis, Strain UIO044" /LENGTH=93 /DNA_ID=CAMNT_0003321139 /DNA_START=545 /DNA_END=822 /DNA_ORIENTATION=-
MHPRELTLHAALHGSLNAAIPLAPYEPSQGEHCSGPLMPGALPPARCPALELERAAATRGPARLRGSGTSALSWLHLRHARMGRDATSHPHAA